MLICIAVAAVTLGLFEAIGHRGQGIDAPGSTTPAPGYSGSPVPAPGDR